jgi:ABC-2 type transport system ATP-binding protein
MIEVVGLTKDYGTRRALDGLNFTVKKGEIVGFLGPNGAGKTTTMRVLAGYLPPTSGTVTVDGKDLIKDSLSIRQITGYLPETVPLYSDMTIRGYLLYMGNLRHLKHVDELVDQAIERVQLTDRSDGYIGNLSKGMRQRVGFAQAILHDPDVLLLDEPTIGLDPAQIHEICNLIKEFGKHKTILFSTHILSEVQQLCDRVLIINKGRILVEDTPEQLQLRLSGGRNVIVRVNGKITPTLAAFKKIKGISTVTPLGENSAQLTVQPDFEARPEIARVVVKEGLDLIELRGADLSLEQIFIQLTAEDESSPNPNLTSAE